MKTLLSLTTFLIIACHAAAFDLQSGIGYGLGGAVPLSNPSASAMLQLPAASPPPYFWQIETSFTRQYELADLDQYQLAVAYRRSRLSCAVGFTQFGKSYLYQEQTVIGAFAYHIRSFAFGGTVQGQWLKFGGGYDGLNAFTASLSGAYRFRKVRLGGVIDNLSEPQFAPSSPALAIQYRAYLELAPNATQTILARVKAESDRPPQWTFAQRFRLGGDNAVMWHFSTDPWKFGGAVELGIKGGIISYAAIYHPILGLTHTVAVGYGHKGARLDKDGN